MAISLCLGLTSWREQTEKSVATRRWSADDAFMVIVWVLALPAVGARFQHDILTPPITHLSIGATFLVAAAAALLELALVALFARLLGRAMRKVAHKALRNLVYPLMMRHTDRWRRYRLRGWTMRTASLAPSSVVPASHA